MKATKTFIEDAIKGGWKDGNKIEQRSDGIALVRFKDDAVYARLSYADILLDPLAWQAVEKARGWGEQKESDKIVELDHQRMLVPYWQYQIHRFIDHLADGLTIEEALEKISN